MPSGLLRAALSAVLLLPAAACNRQEPAHKFTALVESAGSDASIRGNDSSWLPLAANERLGEGAQIRTGDVGTLSLRLPDGSNIRLEPGTELMIESLANLDQHPFIQLVLHEGEIMSYVAAQGPADSFVVRTPLARAGVEGTAFSARHNTAEDLTTIAVEDGVVFVQPDNPELQPLKLRAGEQLSLSGFELGPVVAAGAAPILSEPAFEQALQDLGQWQQCETREGEQEICGTWTWDSESQQFDASWDDGTSAVVKVEQVGGGEIVLTRYGTADQPAESVTRYVGRRVGNDTEGDAAVDLIEGTITWEEGEIPAAGTWRARSHSVLDFGEPQPDEPEPGESELEAPVPEESETVD